MSVNTMYFNIRVYMTGPVTIIVNGEKLKTFPLSSRIRQKFPFVPLLFN